MHLTLTLFLTFSTVLCQIKITPIENGLLTLKLGTMRARSTQHKFIHYVNLQPVNNELESTESQLLLIKERIFQINNCTADTGLLTSLSQAQQLVARVKSKLENLLPPGKTRSKRGLINGIGTASKWLFGTLDDSDRETINKALTKLNENDNHIEYQLRAQMSLTSKLIDEYNETISTLTQNQKTIQNFLTQTITKLKEEINNTLLTVSVQNVLSQLFVNLEYINEFLDELENAITFASWNLVHNSILPKNSLMSILSKAKELYNSQNILELKYFQNYYSYLGTTVHFSDELIIFVISLPILTTEIYSYYHLIPVPVQNLTIIPNTPYLGMSTDTYIATAQSCPKIEDVYICNSPSQPRDDSCLIQLLSEADHNHCPVHHVSVTKPIFTMLEENHILIIPVNTLQIPDCQNGIQTINQPVVLHLPTGCSTTIANQRFTATKSEVALPMFLLPKIEVPKLWNLTVNKNEPLSLKEVDLSDISSLKELAKSIKKSQFTPEYSSFLASTNYWLPTTLFVMLFLIISIISYFGCRKWCPHILPCRFSNKDRRRSPRVTHANQKSPSPGDDATTSAGGVILVSQ